MLEENKSSILIASRYLSFVLSVRTGLQPT
jgi:hypothetical protein